MFAEKTCRFFGLNTTSIYDSTAHTASENDSVNPAIFFLSPRFHRSAVLRLFDIPHITEEGSGEGGSLRRNYYDTSTKERVVPPLRGARQLSLLPRRTFDNRVRIARSFISYRVFTLCRSRNGKIEFRRIINIVYPSPSRFPLKEQKGTRREKRSRA